MFRLSNYYVFTDNSVNLVFFFGFCLTWTYLLHLFSDIAQKSAISISKNMHIFYFIHTHFLCCYFNVFRIDLKWHECHLNDDWIPVRSKNVAADTASLDKVNVRDGKCSCHELKHGLTFKLNFDPRIGAQCSLLIVMKSFPIQYPTVSYMMCPEQFNIVNCKWQTTLHHDVRIHFEYYEAGMPKIQMKSIYWIRCRTNQTNHSVVRCDWRDEHWAHRGPNKMHEMAMFNPNRTTA